MPVVVKRQDPADPADLPIERITVGAISSLNFVNFVPGGWIGGRALRGFITRAGGSCSANVVLCPDDARKLAEALVSWADQVEG